jgi:hypothetical protein
MVYSPLSMARRHVLGKIYDRCDALGSSIPVYVIETDPEGIVGTASELVGHVDETLGHYADAFTFHVPDEVCKRLSGGAFTYTFECEFADAASNGPESRIRLNSISLIARQNYKKPEPRTRVQA